MENIKYPKGKHPNSRNGFKKGRIVTDKEKQAMSKRAKELGIKPPSQLGKKHSEATKEKMKNTHSQRDCKHSQDTKKKIGNANKGKIYSEERRKKYETYWESKRIPGSDLKNPYPKEFNQKLKNLIKEREGNKCLICKSANRLSIHHINYDKNDYCPDNLVTLCASCHAKTNSQRPFWNLFHSVPKRPTKYNLSLAMLSDRLAITTLKSIYIRGAKEQYEKEADDIMHDIELIAKENGTYFEGYGKFVRYTQILCFINSAIWANESKARKGEDQDLILLKLTHSLNRVRNEAMNQLSSIFGEDQDLKSDYMDSELTKQFGYDFSGIFREKNV